MKLKPQPQIFYTLALLLMDLVNGCTLAAPVLPVSHAPAPPLPVIQPALAPPTPDRYAGLTIDDLTARSYGDGELYVEQVLATGAAFTRTLINYESDGLKIYGFMNVPHGDGLFPVIIVNHGYVDPAIYRTLTYTTRYADALLQEGAAHRIAGLWKRLWLSIIGEG